MCDLDHIRFDYRLQQGADDRRRTPVLVPASLAAVDRADPSAEKASSVALRQLRAIDKKRLAGAPMGTLSQPVLAAVARAVRRYFGL